MSEDTINRMKSAAFERRGGRGGMTLREAQAQSGISPATLSRLELGKTPDLETFEKLCRWTGLSADYFLGLDKRG